LIAKDRVIVPEFKVGAFAIASMSSLTFPEPQPPRHTFDDDSSSDEEGEEDTGNQISEYQDIENYVPDPIARPFTEEDVQVNLTENINGDLDIVIGVELLSSVNEWFGPSKQIGHISIRV
jgi:hypothetical protein